MRTSFKPTEIFQYTNFFSCRLPGVTKGFIKGEALRLLRTNSSQTTFKKTLEILPHTFRGYPAASSETQGQLVGTGKSLKRAKKNSGEEKSRTRRRALLLVLDFSSPEFFFARFRLFPVPTNCPWVSEDDPAATLVVKFSEREKSLTNKDRTHERKFYPLSNNTIRLCLI